MGELASLFWSLTWRQSEQEELGGTEMARPQGSHSALQVLSRECFGGCVCVCVSVCVSVSVCAGGNRAGKRRKI